MRLGFVSLRVMDSMGCVFITTTVLSSAKRKASPEEDAAASVAAAFALGIVERPIRGRCSLHVHVASYLID